MNIVKSLFSGVALCLLATQLLPLNSLLETAPFISSLSAQEAPEEHEADSHHEKGGESVHEHGHEESHSTVISASAARAAGVAVTQAGPGVIARTVTAYGRLAVGPEQISHVRARFTGIIREVNATLGETVEAGRQLAQVQSNESLSSYAITAPISGTVLERHANAGEVTQDQVLFTIVDFNGLWAELQIFSRSQPGVAIGQPVHMMIHNKRIDAQVDQLIPALDRPYLTARVNLANANARLMPGELVSAEIEVSRQSRALVIPRQALQTLEGQSGVFVKQGDEYRFSPVQTGAEDHRNVEIISGLEQGDSYVSENSYLIKADIQKSQAEHSH